MPVIRFDVRLRRLLADGRAFGDAGPYEELKGRVALAIDPEHTANRDITDVAWAPRNADGRVEVAADVSLLVPVDRERASRRLLLDVVNRGNTVSVPNFNHATRPVFRPGSDPDPPIDVGDGFLMRHGWVVASCGWQCDLPDLPGLFRLHGVEAHGSDGARLRGRVYVQLQAPEDVAHFLLSDRGHLPYPAADPDEPDAMLLVRDQPDQEPEVLARERWRFARVDGGRVVADPTHVWLEGGFARGRLYHAVYTAEGAPVLGLGMAALRDCAAWLKHGDAAGGNPVPGVLRHAFAYGRSQTGRLLRTMLYWDLHVAEDGREALDGILANVAGGMRGEFNQRFGQNSKDRPHAMAHLFPFTDVPQAHGGRVDALHARLRARGRRVKAMYTNTAAEYHRGDASLIHTDPAGTRDVDHDAHTRVYHFAGTEHGLGVWPPTDAQPAAADPAGWIERSRHLRGTLSYGRLLRACLVNLDRWVRDGIPPPPSRHPRVDDGTAVAPEALASVFARIPGARYPGHHPRPRALDFGVDAEARQTLMLPPRPGPAFGSLVSAVDEDGNEVAGIRLPELHVPIATHTGWNLRHPDIGGSDQMLVFAGATLPFPRTPAEREASGDARRSVLERYASRDEYLARVREAARALVKEGHLLAEDEEISVAFAARAWDYWRDA